MNRPNELKRELKRELKHETKHDTKRQLQIFKAADSGEVNEERMATAEMSAELGEGLQKIVEAGATEGFLLRCLFSDPVSGMSLVYVWLKSNYQLPIHTHNADCAYYIMAGEAIMGNEVLKVGDCFFVPSGVRYSYSAGPEGAEVMEFRNATHFNIDYSGTGPKMMARIAEVSRANLDGWRKAPLPAAVRRFGIGNAVSSAVPG